MTELVLVEAAEQLLERTLQIAGKQLEALYRVGIFRSHLEMFEILHVDDQVSIERELVRREREEKSRVEKSREEERERKRKERREAITRYHPRRIESRVTYGSHSYLSVNIPWRSRAATRYKVQRLCKRSEHHSTSEMPEIDWRR